jgi:hypothetical protein
MQKLLIKAIDDYGTVKYTGQSLLAASAAEEAFPHHSGESTGTSS